MTDATTIALFALTGSAITTVGVCVTSYFSYKAKTIATETKVAVDGRLSELLALTKVSSKAEGKVEEKKDEAARVADLDKSVDSKPTA